MKIKSSRNTKENSTKRKKQKKGKKKVFILIGILAIVGLCFSGGSVGGFFKVLAFEAIGMAGVWFLAVLLKMKGTGKPIRTGKSIVSGKRRPNAGLNRRIYEQKDRRHWEEGSARKNFNWVAKDDDGKKQENIRKTEEISQEYKNDIKRDLMNRIAVLNRSSSSNLSTPYRQADAQVPDDSCISTAQEAACIAPQKKTDEELEELTVQQEVFPEESGDDSEYPDLFDEVMEEALPDFSAEYEEKEELVPHDSTEMLDMEQPVMSGVDEAEAVQCVEKPKAKLYIRQRVPEAHHRAVNPEKREIVRPVSFSKAKALPPLTLLKKAESAGKERSFTSDAQYNGKKLTDTLASFGVGAKVINISEGPTVTRYEIQPDYGVKVSKIVSLTDDIALNLAATGVRLEAPIPGKAAIGIEIPNREVMPVLLRDVIESDEFMNHPSKIAFAVGKDIAGNVVVADIAKMPHLLIAGATGSGKSVCINTLVASILYKASPTEVKLLMVDPKVVELSIYNGIPHLLIPVVTDPKKAAGALNWAVQEMTNRYKLFADNNVRDLTGYNTLMRERGEENTFPQVVIIIDELADLMMAAPDDVEDCICRLAQMARAAGMHLVIATQRPSVDVITGVIKANVPSRISFAVSSQIDSRTILDMAGAEKLLGRGDMLFNPIGKPKPVRVQGALITDREVEAVVSYVKSNAVVQYDEEIIKRIDRHSEPAQPDPDNDDELLPQVVDMVIEQGQASTSLIQRKFKIGYSRAARILDQLEAGGVVGPFEGSKPRKVMVTRQQWEENT